VGCGNLLMIVEQAQFGDDVSQYQVVLCNSNHRQTVLNKLVNARLFCMILRYPQHEMSAASHAEVS
jgi:hypothetical protein